MKTIKITISFFCILFVLASSVLAYTYDFTDLDDQGLTSKDDKGGNTIVGVTEDIMGTAITVIRVVGTGIAIIMLTYIAIKYMSAAPNEKAEFKKSATAYIVGAVVLMGTTQILGIIYDFANATVK